MYPQIYIPNVSYSYQEGDPTMIWHSVWQMTLVDLAIDLAIIFVVLYASFTILTLRYQFPDRQLRRAYLSILAGLTIAALFYTADVLIMHLMAWLIPASGAMATLENLHLNLSWPAALSSIGLIAMGLAAAARRHVVLQDALKNSMTAHSRSEARYQTVAETQLEMLCRWRADGTRTFVNDAYVRFFGKPRNQLLGTVALGFVLEDDITKVDRLINSLTPSEPTILIENRVLRADGEVAWLRTSMTALYDDDGTVIEYQAASHDITDVLRTQDELKDSEERFRIALENAVVGSIVIDANGIIEAFNIAAEKMFGFSAAEVIGRNVSMLMPATDAAAHDSYIKNFQTSGVKKIIGKGREMVGRRKSGEEFPMHLGVGEMISQEKQRFIGSITDMTDVKELERQLRQAHRMEAVGQLTGGIAHDFNNLLAVMIGNSELLEDRVAGDEIALKRVNAIKNSVGRAASLTNRLLSFSRQQPLLPVVTNVTELADGLSELLQRTLGETIDLRIAPSAGHAAGHAASSWPATIDPHQFENALINLAINARDAMQEGGTLHIETSNITLDTTFADAEFARGHEDVAPGDYICVAVTDTGTGMSRETRERVFEPFFTTKGVGEGSGLGLSMVYGFAKQSNGHVTIDSRIGSGTVVKLYLPRSQPPQPEKGVADEGGETNMPDLDLALTPSGSEHILVVEDDLNVRDVPAVIFRDHGYQTVEVADGPAALNALQSDQSFDLLFTDIVLPGGMTGFDIAKAARRLQPQIKIIYTTGHARDPAGSKEDWKPDAPLIAKPYRRTDLLEKIRAVLDES